MTMDKLELMSRGNKTSLLGFVHVGHIIGLRNIDQIILIVAE